MLGKRILLVLIIVSFLCAYSPQLTNTFLKKGFGQGMSYYADLIAKRIPVKILYNPGLRDISRPENMDIWAVLPECNDFPKILDDFLNSQANAIVQCSKLDSWHCTKIGNEYLHKIREKAYRIVIFDGGHHLPTLGMEPDIIIIPELNNYAVHSYMLDGIKTETILDIIKEIKAPIIVAQVSRWALVKQENSMQKVADEVIYEAGKLKRKNLSVQLASHTRMSLYRSTILAYVDKNYASDLGLFYKNMQELGLDGVEKIYLAFDYSWLTTQAAQDYAKNVHSFTNVKVEIVNQPIKVSNSFRGAL
ncbi:MAG TPA: hypothetical protein VFD02_08000 [Syntrophomonadaceae bacterium]|nr:hypothetical protein [Syntrophomonadaceae bacterium]